MRFNVFRAAWTRVLLASAFGVAGSPEVRAGITLSYDLPNGATDANGGTTAASGASWLANSFSTDSSSYQLGSVTLLLQNSVAGTSEVDIYTDSGEQPGSLVGTLSAPSSVSTSSLSDTTYTASNITLAANTTYWVVLRALSGEFDWGWTADDTGTGVGFTDAWAQSDDTGADWTYFNSSPFQMDVEATPGLASVPEPGSMALVAAGLAIALAWRGRHPDRSRAVPRRLEAR